jgi:hypothetical protein
MDQPPNPLSVEFLAPEEAQHEASPAPQGTIFGTPEELPPKELAERIAQHATQMSPRT